MEKQLNRQYIELGCGKNKKKGYFGIDIANVDNVDLAYDLNKGIPLKDESVKKYYTSHFLEHVNDPLFLIEEMYRTLEKGGIAEIIVPHWSWFGSYTFMHYHFFHSLDFDFFDPDNDFNYYTKAKFKT